MPDSKFFPYQADFAAGELTPRLFGQIEFEAYFSGCKTLKDFVTLAQGPIERRGALVTLAAGKQSDNSTILVPFSFSTDHEQSYVLEIGYDNTALGYMRIFHKPTKTDGHVVEIIADGTRNAWNGSGYTETALDEGPLWVDDGTNDDIVNIRITQINDVLYIVDGRHKIQKIVRSGSTQPGTWTIQAIDLVAETFSVDSDRNYALWTFVWDNYVALTGGNNIGSKEEIDGMLDVGESGVSIDSESVHTDSTYGCAWSNNAFYESIPTYLSSRLSAAYALDGFVAWGWVMDGQLWIKNTDTYHFAVNAVTNADVIVEGTKVAGKYDLADANWGSVNGESEFLNTGSITLTGGKNHPLQARYIYIASQVNAVGLSVAYRRDGAENKDGVTNGNADALTFVRNWKGGSTRTASGTAKGNGVFEIIIKIAPNTTSFGWTYRLNTLHPEEEVAAWPSDDTAATGAGNDDPGGWIVKPNDVDGVALPVSGYALNSSGDQYAKLLATITMGNSNHTEDDIRTFKVGFQIIPATVFNQATTTATTSYPRVIDAWEQRMFIGGQPEKPNALSGSVINDEENFTKGTRDGDAFDRYLYSNKLDKIQFIKGGRRMIAGTTGKIFVIGADEKTVTPAFFPSRPHTVKGAAFVDPLLIESVVIFVDRGKFILWELEYTITSDAYKPKDITIRSEHLFHNKIKGLAFQQSGLISKSKTATDVVWAWDESGNLYSCTYQREHDVISWARHDVGGAVLSVITTPWTTGDEAWMLVQRNSTNYIEYLDSQKLADGITAITSGNPAVDLFYLHNPVLDTVTFKCDRFTSQKVAVMDTNDDVLSDTAGEPIEVTMDATGAGVFTSAADPGTFHVGYCYESEMSPMPIEVKTERGTSKGMNKSFTEFYVECLDTEKLTVDDEVVDTVTSTTVPESVQVYVPDWDIQKYVTIKQSHALPATIVSVHGELEVHGG